ncbi:YceI family protein [Streptomyces sp. NPDC057580]|uniref:YceI family protein n=1 Tax=Streptomyces sp. NPDC057580 TaxID=3346173 RepID=UPI00367E487D
MNETMNTGPATAAIPDYLAGTWKADPAHSEIAFSVRLLGISKTRGRFTTHDVMLVTDKNPLRSSVTATIDLASIDTGNEKRDNHLHAAEYLEPALQIVVAELVSLYRIDPQATSPASSTSTLRTRRPSRSRINGPQGSRAVSAPDNRLRRRELDLTPCQ